MFILKYFHLRWNVADGCFDIVRDPLDEEGRVLCLHVEHLLVHLVPNGQLHSEAGLVYNICQVLQQQVG